MPEAIQSESSATVGQDGVQPKPGDSPETTTTEPKTQTRTVSWESHKRALDDMHKFKGRMQEAEKRESDAEGERLKAQDNYKGLAERETVRADKAVADAKSVTELYINTFRGDKFKEAAVKAGLMPEAMADLDLLDLSDLPVEVTSNNRYIVQGVETKVEQLKNERAHWFKKESAPNVNGAGGGAPLPGNAKIAPEDVIAAERAYKTGRLPYAEYVELDSRYRKQFAK